MSPFTTQYNSFPRHRVIFAAQIEKCFPVVYFAVNWMFLGPEKKLY